MARIEDLCGWVDAPLAVESQLMQMPHPMFASAAPGLMKANYQDVDILLYKAWTDVLGKYPDYVAQAIGDCTSFGNGHGTDLLACIEIALGNEAESFKETCTEALYGAGREIANMLGSRGDGCYGAALARAVTTIGTISREAVGAYDGNRARSWGYHGLPAEIKQQMAAHKVGVASLVSTLEELDVALANMFPVPVCSSQGFTLQRDADGFCQASGRWEHCMLIAAKRVTKRPGYLICQSWGDRMPTGPKTLDQPDFSFWAEPAVVAHMLASRDSFLLSKFDGYPGSPRPRPGHWSYGGFA